MGKPIAPLVYERAAETKRGESPRATISLRRTRLHGALHALTKEVRLHPDQFIQPLFAVQGLSRSEPIPGLPNAQRHSTADLLKQIEADLNAGVNKVLLFVVPEDKSVNAYDPTATESTVRLLRDEFGEELWLAIDICLCSHTTHGHCGWLDHRGTVNNARSVSTLAAMALAAGQAGVDCVAPSDMMDGRVGAIRSTLDEHGCEEVSILSYAAKFSSSLYGPFRVAADSAPTGTFGPRDRSTYQIDPARPKDALRSARRDAKEGADLLMIKPALPNLDVLHRVTRSLDLPWCAYQVSGECAGIELLAQNELTNRRAAYLEAWTSIVRAGAQGIVTYAAREAPDWIRQ